MLSEEVHVIRYNLGGFVNQSLVEKLNQNWYSVAIVNLLILGLVMLFYKELSDEIKTYLVPALLVYAMGNALIGYIQGSYFRANGGRNEFQEPLPVYYFLYCIWFALFLVYLFYRNVL